MSIKFLRFTTFLAFSVFSLSCSSSDTSETTDLTSETTDLFTYRSSDSGAVFQSDKNGENVSNVTIEPAKSVWMRQEEIINGVCAGVISPENPIKVVTPDGHVIGPLNDSWSPAWSPDGELAAFSCGKNDQGEAFLVTTEEQYFGDQLETIDGWSRDSSGKLSDRMEVLITNKEGNYLHQLTLNNGGDWLPQWFADGQSIMLESNRNDNSNIYVHSLKTTEVSPFLRNNRDNQQSPAFSRDYEFIAFTEERSGILEIVTYTYGDAETLITGHYGRPISWPK